MMKNLKNLKSATRSTFVTLAIIIVFYAVVEAMIITGHASRHMKSLLVPICYNAIRCVSLNFVIGFLGELSLGHAGFMSVGAYSSCLFSIWMQNTIPAIVRFPVAMLVGGIVSAIFGLIVGVPVLRLKGDYLAIVTLAFGEIIRNLIINMPSLGGAAGLKKMPQDSSFTWGIAALIITVIVISNIIDSKTGRAVQALRDNTIAAQAVGINTSYYKVIVFVVAAFFAGIAGAIYGHNYSIMTPGTFDYNKSIEFLVMVVFGGLGSVRGSVIAAAVITILPEMLRGFSDYRMLMYALALIALMLANNDSKFELLKAKIFRKKNENNAIELTDAQEEI